MDEHVQHELALACVRLAQQITEADEEMQRTGPSRTSKAQQEALQALLSVGDQPHLAFDLHLGEVLWQLYATSPPQSNARQRVTQMLLDLANRRDLPFGDAVEAAHILYRMAPKGSEEKQQAIQMLLTQAQWPGVTMKQSVEAVLALCYASPLRSKERQQGIQVLLDLAQRPDLSVEDALVLMTLDSDMTALIASTPAWEKRQQASRKRLLQALAQRSDLTSEQAVQLAEWGYPRSG
jgi:hypothetical protein